LVDRTCHHPSTGEIDVSLDPRSELKSGLKRQLKSLVFRVVPRSRYKYNFLLEIADSGSVFDIGCGNDSPKRFKAARPDIRYVGLDIQDCGQNFGPEKDADEYVVTSPEGFRQAIEDRENLFDAVVSSHNLEHCLDPYGVVPAMARALKPGGRLYLSFPAAHSVRLPSREGSLNFYDDPTHVQPPDFRTVIRLLQEQNINVDFAAERYRPPFWVMRGILSEPLSRTRKAVRSGTWALYGFETIIWGTKVGGS